MKIIPLGTGPGLDPKTDFKFELPDNPESDSTFRPDHFAPGYFGRMWQPKRLLIENNVIEVAERKLHPVGPWNRPAGIFIYGSTLQFVHQTSPSITLTQRRFPQVIIRGNVIRHRDNGSDPNPAHIDVQARGIEIQHARDVLIEHNTITLDRQYPIDLVTCDIVSTFKNQSSSGKLIVAQLYYLIDLPDRETILLAQFEEATLLSLLI